MSDLIHKEDAVYAVLEVEPFIVICGGEWDGEVLQRGNDVTKAIMSVPSADAVEVVRCKDCKWRGHLGCALRIVDDSDKPKDDDFCSFGERREP